MAKYSLKTRKNEFAQNLAHKQNVDTFEHILHTLDALSSFVRDVAKMPAEEPVVPGDKIDRQTGVMTTTFPGKIDLGDLDKVRAAFQVTFRRVVPRLS